MGDPQALGAADDAYGVIPELKSGGYTHYVCVPLMFSSGRKRNGVTFSTREPKGFTAAHFAFFRAILPALRALMEIRAGERILDEILQTYVGNDPHDRILAGDIHRGSVTRIRSAILFSDLRGYTELSMTLQEEDIADLLNRYFDCIVPQVECRGGEVLKFIGDGVLAIFQDADGNAAQTCNHALDAAASGLEGIAKANAYGSLPAPLIAGIALHYGQAAYGNVGSDERLDCRDRPRHQLREPDHLPQCPPAAAGADVGAFAGHITTGKEYLGMHEFKGVPGSIRYAPA
jgi:adenylate cyclase